MMDHDEMFSYVLAKCEKRQQQRKRRTRIVRQAVLAGMCLAVVIGAGVRNRLGSIETAPEKPPAPETTVVTATETAVSTTAATVTTQRTTTTAAVTSSQKQTETSAVTTTAPTQQTTAAPTTRPPETTAVTAYTVLTETSCSTIRTETVTTTSESKAGQISIVTKVFSTEQATESSMTETSTKNEAPWGFHQTMDDTEAQEITQSALPTISGFEVSWSSNLWHIRCTKPVSPSPESTVFYTVSSDHFTLKTRNTSLMQQWLAAMYVFAYQDSKDQILVMQNNRDTFSFKCVPFAEPEGGEICGHPCIWGRQNGTALLYWDDGSYTFVMQTGADNREMLAALAECLIPSEESNSETTSLS